MNDTELNELFSSKEVLVDRSNVRILLLAGGKGSRMVGITQDTIPKTLLEIGTDGIKFPMLDYGFMTIPKNFQNLSVVTSSDPAAHPDQVLTHINEYNGQMGENISVFKENEPRGTAGAVASYIEETGCREEIIVVSPADTMFPFEKMNQIIEDFMEKSNGLSWVLTSDPGISAQNASKIAVDGDKVTETREADKNSLPFENGMTSVGMVILRRSYFTENYNKFVSENSGLTKVDMYRDFIPWLISQGESIGYYDIKKPAQDLGDPDRFIKAF